MGHQEAPTGAPGRGSESKHAYAERVAKDAARAVLLKAIGAASLPLLGTPERHLIDSDVTHIAATVLRLYFMHDLTWLRRTSKTGLLAHFQREGGYVERVWESAEEGLLFYTYRLADMYGEEMLAEAVAATAVAIAGVYRRAARLK